MYLKVGGMATKLELNIFSDDVIIVFCSLLIVSYELRPVLISSIVLPSWPVPLSSVIKRANIGFHKKVSQLSSIVKKNRIHPFI